MLNMVLAFLNIGTSEMLLIVFVALLLFGGKKLPELARGLGRGIREFKDASETIKRDISEQINNFEKDVEVDKLIVDDVDQEVESAMKSPEPKRDSAAPKDAKPENEASQTQEPQVEELKPKPDFPTMGPPVGTYQHNPGREPDYVGSQDVYNEDNQPVSTNPEDQASDSNTQTEPNNRDTQ